MQLNPDKLNELAAEWDPTPFVTAMEQASAMPATGMVGGDFGWVNGQPQPKPPSMGMLPAQQQQLMGMMQPKQQAPQPAPAVQPAKPGGGVPQYPGIPKIGQVPSLAEILQGRSA